MAKWPSFLFIITFYGSKDTITPMENTAEKTFEQYMDDVFLKFKAFFNQKIEPLKMNHGEERFVLWYTGRETVRNFPLPPVLFKKFLGCFLKPEDSKIYFKRFWQITYVVNAREVLNIKNEYLILDYDDLDLIHRNWTMILEMVFFRYFDEKYLFHD